MAKQEAPYTIRVGRGIKAKVWTNNGSKSTWYNVTFARSQERVLLNSEVLHRPSARRDYG